MIIICDYGHFMGHVPVYRTSKCPGVILPDQSSLLLFSMFRENVATVSVRKGYEGVGYCMAIMDFMGLGHTGKCMRRFVSIYAYCRYFIDRKL